MQVAVSAASWVVGKALAPVTDGLLEAWAASKDLGPNIRALKMELLYVQAMLENAHGRVVRGRALKEMLDKLRELAYGAEDVLDELDYFRIQDELEGTQEATDVDARGAIRDAILHVRHTAKAVAKQLSHLCSCSRPIMEVEVEGDHGEPEQGDGKPRAICSSWPCAKRQIAGSNTNDKAAGGCVHKLASGARHTVRAAGKFFPCCSSPPAAQQDAGSDADGPDMTDYSIMLAPKLEFRRVEISNRMKDIVDELKPLCTKVATILNLDLLESNRSIVKDIAAALLTDPGHTPIIPKNVPKTRPKTTSEILEPRFFGRQQEAAKIIHDITEGDYSDRDLTVLPIVGLGGMGKTTLAQHVYKEVQRYFDVNIWICVSLNFSVGRLTKQIAESIPKLRDDRENGNQEKLIEQRLKSKKFLLVLDDMWNFGDEDEWNKLLAPLRKTQSKGNIILVTTRSPALGQIVKSETVEIVELEGLDEKSYWDLFLAFVFDGDASKNELLLEIGKEIVKKLKGSPLAAKTVGRLLRNYLDAHHWKRVLDSKEWELQTGDHDIMPALKLSYDYLPFHLQQCFSYCTLFPQDYKFDRNELIRWWIGLDLLHFSDGQNKSVDDIGQCVLKDLEDNGFFKEDKIDGKPCYIIHDLLHDLGLKVASRECISIDQASVRSVEIWPSIRHLSIIVDGADESDGMMTRNLTNELEKLKKKLKIENIRSLMIFGIGDESLNGCLVELIRNANGLRVLHWSHMINPHIELSALHLRYLSLRNTFWVETDLPSMLSRFYLLRILNLQVSWFGIRRLPRDMSNLTKLHHFLTNDNDGYHSQIYNVGKLQFLQELNRFEVNKENKGFELKQLGNLAELRELGIYNLEKVHTKEEAAQAQLIDKIHLHKLTLDWNIEVPRNDRDVKGVVLDGLQPARNLQELYIKGHGSRFCPTWLGRKLFVKALRSLCLDGVDWEALPWWGHMLALQELTLKNMCGVKEFSPSHFGSITTLSFGNLNKLELISLNGLEKCDLGDHFHSFSRLQQLIIRNCPELLGLPFAGDICYPPMERGDGTTQYIWFPNLEVLEITDCPKVVVLPPIPWTDTLCYTEICDVGSLQLGSLEYSKPSPLKAKLQIYGKDELHTLDEVLCLSNLTDLQDLYIKNCPPLELKHLQMLTSLKKLEVDSGHVLACSEREGGGAPCHVPVERLVIDSNHATGNEVSQLLSHLPNLSDLTIRSCEKMTWLGVLVDQEKIPNGLRIEDGLLLFPTHLSNSLHKLVIRSCPELSLLAEHHSAGALGAGLQPMHCLQDLTILECPKFMSVYEVTSSPSYCFPFPSSLQQLQLVSAGNMGTLEPLSNLTSLTRLFIQGCGEDFRGEGLWALLTQGQLTDLFIYDCPKFFLGSDLMQELPDFEDHRYEQRLPCPPKLRSLRTDDITGVLAAPICTLLSSSLTELILVRNQQVERLDKQQEDALQLLTSLQDLEFRTCERLQALPAGLHTLPSLNILVIFGCPAIRSLPKDGLPSSLQELQVGYCGNEELKQQCRNYVRDHPGSGIKLDI